MIYGGNLMNEFQKLYIERKKQFKQSEGDKESVVALYNLKKYLETIDSIDAKEVLVNVYDLLNYKKDAYDLLVNISDSHDIKIKKRLAKVSAK